MGLNVNRASDLTDKERRERSGDEAYVDAVDELVRTTPEIGISAHRSIDLVAPGAEIGLTFAEINHIHADLADDTSPVLRPVSILELEQPDEDGDLFDWLLTDADVELVEAGLYCHRCLKRQTPLATERCTPFEPDNPTCGAVRRYQPM